VDRFRPPAALVPAACTARYSARQVARRSIAVAVALISGGVALVAGSTDQGSARGAAGVMIPVETRGAVVVASIGPNPPLTARSPAADRLATVCRGVWTVTVRTECGLDRHLCGPSAVMSPP
jgi:hypothetical protein